MDLKTGINAYHFLQNIIRPSLCYIGLYSESAEILLLGTAAHESCMGHYFKQLQGPALGVYQIEPETHVDVWENYISYRKDLKKNIKMLYPNKVNNDMLVYDLRYATIIARLIYFRVSDPLPEFNDLNTQARYWKKHYNTVLGKGTVSGYISSFNKLCK